jgi:6-phosphogluconolactonase
VSVGAPQVRRFGSADGLSTEVAATLLATLRDVQSEGRVPSVALTGGTIAAAIHEAVPASPDVDSVDWARVDVWFGDERYLPADDKERNAGEATRTLLDRLPFDRSRVHLMPASDAGFESLDAAAASYAAEVREQGTGTFDVVMLGVGPDGHVASLFPGFPHLDVDDAITVGVTGSPKPPPERITLTLGALTRAKQVWFVVSGDGKADAVARALAADGDVHDTPARGVHGIDQTIWFIDEAAASKL